MSQLTGGIVQCVTMSLISFEDRRYNNHIVLFGKLK